jgi:hypothetical protein
MALAYAKRPTRTMAKIEMGTLRENVRLWDGKLEGSFTAACQIKTVSRAKP